MKAVSKKAERVKVSAPIRTPQDPVLIWSNEHRAWWKPDGMGYGRDILEAGIYRRADAEARTPGRYLGRIVEAGEVGDELWDFRGEPAAVQLIFGLGLLQVEPARRMSRLQSHTILPIAPAIQPVLSPENAQLVVDGLVALGTPEARALADELVTMAHISG